MQVLINKITVSSLSNFGKIFEKKPEKIKTTGSQDFVKVLLDRSGTFLISASSDKYFTIQDMLSNTLVTKGTVGDQITSIQLTLDNKYLITTSARGLIYFWKINEQITKAMTQRLKEQDIQIPTLSDPCIPDLRMPPISLKKTSAKATPLVKKQTSDEWTEDPNQKLFGGKSPAEILFNKNKQKNLIIEESKEGDMTKSQLKRKDVQDITDLVGNIAEDIGNMFSTNNQEAIMKARADKSPKYSDTQSVTQAEFDDELAVATGQVPDWAVTKGGTTLIKANEVPVKENEYHYDREMDNAESSITLLPSPKAKFTIEKGVDKKISDDDQSFSQTKDEDRESYDQNEFNILKQGTGKFFDDNSDDEKSPEKNPPARRQWKQSNDSPSKSPTNIELVEDAEPDNSAGEIESILIKNQNNDKKPPQRSQWNKPKKPIGRIGTHLVEDKNAINYMEVMKGLKEGVISKDDIPEGFMEGLDMIAQTPKPNLKYPVPSNEYGEASFGSRSDKIQQMRQTNMDVDIDSLDKTKESLTSDQKANSMKKIPINIHPESKGTEPNNQQRSRIPTLKKDNVGQSKERRVENKKQIRSFIEEHNDELEAAPIPQKQEVQKTLGKSPKMAKFTSQNFLGVDNDSTKNNYNLSNQQNVKSEGNSEKEDFLQKEDSVHMDDNRHGDVKSETYQYPNTESVGDTQLAYLMNDSNTFQADPVTTAAVNASMNVELQKINESLQKLANITSRADSKGVEYMPEVSDSLNRSFNLLLTTMANLKANSSNGFQAKIQF